MKRRCEHCWALKWFNITWSLWDKSFLLSCNECGFWEVINISEELKMEYEDLEIRKKIFKENLNIYFNNL